jgi:hypothetical protein
MRKDSLFHKAARASEQLLAAAPVGQIPVTF